MPYFLCKLIPPRPTYGQDLTPQEQWLMQEHGMYWRSLGVAVVFGPVLDPKGGGNWGVAVVEADNEAKVREFCENDPVTKANRGFKWEIFTMAAAVVRN